MNIEEKLLIDMKNLLNNIKMQYELYQERLSEYMKYNEEREVQWERFIELKTKINGIPGMTDEKSKMLDEYFEIGKKYRFPKLETL